MRCFVCQKSSENHNICSACAIRVYKEVKLRAMPGHLHVLIKRGLVSELTVIEKEPETQNNGLVLSHGARDLEDLTGEVVFYNRHGGIQTKIGPYTLHVIEEARVVATLGR